MTVSPSSSRNTTPSASRTVRSSDRFTMRLGSSSERAEENAPSRRVIEQRADQMAVFVEAGGLADERHDSVSLREIEQGVDVGVRHFEDGLPKGLLRVEFAIEPLAPARLVTSEGAGVKTIGTKRFTGHLRCQ